MKTEKYQRKAGKQHTYAVEYGEHGYTIKREGTVKRTIEQTPSFTDQNQALRESLNLKDALRDIENLFGMEE